MKNIGLWYLQEVHSIIPKEVVAVINQGYLDVENDFSEQLLYPYQKERKEIKIYLKK